jgi:PAS domain S-box-containing protein
MEKHPDDKPKAELAELRQQLAATTAQIAELETSEGGPEGGEWRARVSASQWRATFDAIGDAVFLLDAGGTIVLCNQALVDLLGKPRSAVIGRQCREVVQEIGGSVESCPFERALETLRRATTVWQLDERWFEATVDPMLDEDGYLIGFVHILVDITARKRGEQARRRRNLELGLLHRAAQAFGSTLDLEELLTTILEEVRRALDVDGCSIWLADPQAHELVCQGAAGLGSEVVRGWRLAPGEGFIGWVTARGKSLIVPDARADERHFKGVDVQTGLEIRSVLAVPMRVKDKVIGTLEAVDAEVARLGVTDRNLLESLAASAAIAIQNARLYEAAEAEIAERKRAEEALRGQTAELARSNALIAALSQVAARLQTNLNPDQVMEILGTELRILGLDSVVGLLDPDGQTTVVRYISTASSVLTKIEKLLGRKLPGLRAPPLPIHDELVERGRAVFVPSVMPMVAAALPDVPNPVLKRTLQLGGLRPDSPAFYLPLAVEGRVFGVLSIVGEDLREDDLPVVSVFANQAAIAFENARLYEAEHAARERLRDLAGYLQDAREEERKRIAREVHDELGQALTALKFDVAQLQKWLPGDEPGLRERADAMAALIDASMRTVRRVSTELRPGLLDDLGLAAAIEWQVGEFAERTGIRCDLHLGEEDVRLESEVATALFRVLQETLTNVARHAGASEVRVELVIDPREVVLRVRDDGRGISESEASSHQALGLLGVRERARSLGGGVRFDGVRGQGTTVTVRIPYHGSYHE